MPSLDTVGRLGRPPRARHRCRPAKSTFNSDFCRFVLQIMDRPYQLSESTRLDGVFSVLKVSYRTLDNAGLAREELSRKLLGSCPDLVEVFRIHYQLTRGRRESGGLRALDKVVNSLDYEMLMLPLTLRRVDRFARVLSWS